MKKIILIFFSLIVLGFFGVVGLLVYKYNFPKTDTSYACTMEAKLCPDGSSVGRSGPDCAFAPCPEAGEKMTENEAEAIALKYCIKGGEVLGVGLYDIDSRAWLFNANLNATREDCKPICVVSEETRLGEIKWQCNKLSE